MSWDLSTIIFIVLGAVMLAGGVAVVFARDTLRMGLGLGAFLVAVAGMYLYFAMPFLAVAQLFVYVGGVLVLILFAVMLLQTTETGEPKLESRHDVGSVFVAGGVFALIVLAFWRTTPDMSRGRKSRRARRPRRCASRLHASTLRGGWRASPGRA